MHVCHANLPLDAGLVPRLHVAERHGPDYAPDAARALSFLLFLSRELVDAPPQAQQLN